MVMLISMFVNGNAPRANVIRPVTWFPPATNSGKRNTYKVDRGCHGPTTSTCGGVFRDMRATNLGCLSINFGIRNTSHTDHFGAIITIELPTKEVGMIFG